MRTTLTALATIVMAGGASAQEIVYWSVWSEAEPQARVLRIQLARQLDGDLAACSQDRLHAWFRPTSVCGAVRREGPWWTQGREHDKFAMLTLR